MTIKKANLPPASITPIRPEEPGKITESARSSLKATPELQSRWSSFVANQAAQGGAVDPNALVQAVLRESYLQTTEDLKFYAEKVKYFNACKKEVRDYLKNLRGMDSALKSVKELTPANADVLQSVMLVLKDSVKATNEDKKYYLGKLQSLTKVAQEINAYQQKVSNAADQLSGAQSGRKKKGDDD